MTASFLTSLWELFVAFQQWLVSLFSRFMQKATSGPEITLDTGRRVRLGRQIAEGGFSYVFECVEGLSHPARSPTAVSSGGAPRDAQPRKFALKQIRCPEPEMLNSCRQEAAVHRATMNNPNILPLLGFTVAEGSVCYMLFPLMNRSLRKEINLRIFDTPVYTRNNNRQPPWNEVEALNLFLGILRAVQALHEAHYSHRDIKVENVMFSDSTSTVNPVLMDFGSVGPLSQEISTRRQVMELVETAAQHTTMPYRPPELFEGGVRSGDLALDFTKVDVWSLGCTLFAILYGASPTESEFSRADGELRVVECTQLKVLGPIPTPPAHTPAASWYSKETRQLIEQMLAQDRSKRPTVTMLMSKVEAIIEQLGGQVVQLQAVDDGLMGDFDDDGDLDSLLNSNRNFV